MTVVGIDLGTTNTVVASVRQGKVHVLGDEHGQRLLPSVVSFHPNGEVLVGGAAKARRVIDPKNTVYSHKRLIGRSWGSPEIMQAKQRFAFELREGPGQGPLVHARQQDYTLPEISAFVLKRARQIAEVALGTPIERAVITVPAHFNELQRASTKVAGRVSGLEVLRILNEPTAAALAYGLGRSGNERVAVYDFGGGTFDCTLLDLNGNVFEVLATAGDSFLGGDDIDNMIAERMAENYLKAYRYDARTDASMFERLKVTAEEMKMQLSTAEQHTVVLKDFGFGNSGSSIHYTFTLTRRDLEAMITPLVDRSFKVTQDALSLARLTPTSFDKVILVGGSTRVPLIRKRVEAFFGAPPMDRVNPDEVVAIGAAIQAAALTEGAKRRSIPAPPPVMGHAPTTQRGLQNDLDATSTATVDRSKLGPNFGPTSGGPQTKGGPPPTGLTGARQQSRPDGGPRKITNPGVAPATLPFPAERGARGSVPTTGDDDDPSIASFPDLQVPTPFEWFPSSGQPGSGPTGGADLGKTAVSERSFGGNTAAGAQDPSTMTAAIAPTLGQGPGFGAIDEPPSMYSTPSASLPSFPSMTGAAEGGMPSPIGEPEPFDTNPGVSTPGVPGGKFGTVRDLSLISTSGIETSPGVSGDKGAFGHVSDLSLISTNTETAAMEAITNARQQALAGGTFDDQNPTDAIKRDAHGNFHGRLPGSPGTDDQPDLPSVVEKADLPSLSKGKQSAKRPEIQRKQGQLGALPSGSSAMLGRPPAPVAPQPFGPMEKVDEPAAPGPMSRTGVMQNRPPAPAPAAARAAATQQSRQQQPPPVPPGGAGVRPPAMPGPPANAGVSPHLTSAMPARPAPPVPKPLDTTSPLNQRSPVAPTQMSEPFGSAPPPGANQHPSGFPRNAPMVRGFSNAPPAGPAFGSAPPPPPPMPPPAPAPYAQTQAANAYPSAPPGGTFGSQPPGPAAYGQGPGIGGSQQPIFGSFSSAPPEADPYQNVGSGGYEQVNPGAPLAPQNLGYAAPILVDVTPRALVVETAGGYTDTIIPRNAKIPCERTRRFATGRDMQTTVRVRVGQGEHAFFPQNTFLGEVELSGLRPAPRGEVVVAVTFEVDADGTMRVRARDVQTGHEARATLQLVGVADESSVVMMINRFAQQPVGGGGGPPGPGGGAPPGYPI